MFIKKAVTILQLVFINCPSKIYTFLKHFFSFYEKFNFKQALESLWYEKMNDPLLVQCFAQPRTSL